MKYFLDCDTLALHSVPKKFQYYIDIIKNPKSSDYEINDAKDVIVKNCKIKLYVTALTQTL